MPNESGRCSAGLKASTLSFLEQSGISYTDAYALFLFLRCGDAQITSELVRLKFLKCERPGHSRKDATIERIKSAAKSIRDHFEKAWICWKPEWVEAARGVCGGTMADDVICGADTMPISVRTCKRTKNI